MANKSLHLTVIPLSFIASGELGHYTIKYNYEKGNKENERARRQLREAKES